MVDGKILEFLKENRERFKNLSISTMIERGDEPFIIELAIIMGSDIHQNDDIALKAAIRRDENDAIRILKILYEAGMRFDTKTASEAIEIVLSELKNTNIATFLIETK